MKGENIMKVLLFALICMFAVSVYAGNCDHSWQTASDGSRCGGRAADQRPGGRF